MVLVKDMEADETPDNLHRVGVAAKVLQIVHAEEENAHILVNNLERFIIDDLMQTEEGLVARVSYHYSPELSVNPELQA